MIWRGIGVAVQGVVVAVGALLQGQLLGRREIHLNKTRTDPKTWRIRRQVGDHLYAWELGAGIAQGGARFHLAHGQPVEGQLL